MAPIHDAAMEGDIEEVIRLVEADPRGMVLESTESVYGWTPLHCAIAGDYTEKRAPVVSYLLHQGAKVNARDNNGYTALHWSTLDFGVVKLLVSKGANPVLARPDGMTPLMDAVLNDYPAMVKYLLTFKTESH